jgi:hypothetical protein
MSRALVREGWPRGRTGRRARLSLSLSHANACNPLLQAHQPWAQDNTKATVSPYCFSPPLCVPSRADPSGLGHAVTINSSVQGPPGVETPTMRHHLTSLHESICDIVEFGAQAPQVGDEDYDSDEATQIRHFNSQATSILLASLCREEYNKVQGLKNAKVIRDVLKTAHEGDELTKITKRETIEGELRRFVLNKEEEPQAMYNRLKTMVNQVRNLGSTKWNDHEMVKVILRSLVFRNPTQVQLIRGDPRYKQMSLEEVIGNFVSFELMIEDSKHIVN